MATSPFGATMDVPLSDMQGPGTAGISKYLTSYSHNRMNTIRTEIGPQLQSFNLPRRLFVWIYSVSLVILMIISLVLSAVTVIDVISQSIKASFGGIKLFIVIIACVVFIVGSALLYFSRLYQHRVSMNDIPAKSVYVPFENDMPNRAFKHIDRKLETSCEIKARAGPLHNKSATINHPGLSPPEYIQQASPNGNLLPPNIKYQEVIQSLSDKFNRHETSVSGIMAPKHYTFREICIYLVKDLIENKNVSADQFPNFHRLISLYEKFRFGPNLIKEDEMMEFMLHFSDLSDILMSKFGAFYSYRKKRPKHNHNYGSSISQVFRTYSTERSNFQYGYSDFSDSDGENAPAQPETDRASFPDTYEHQQDDNSVMLKRYQPFDSHSLVRQSSGASQGSTIKNKLSLPRPSQVSFSTSSGNLLRPDRLAFSRVLSHNSSVTKYSGYNSDVDEGSEPNNRSSKEQSADEAQEQMSDDSDGGVYNFRRRTIPDVPRFTLRPSTPPANIPALRDVEIRRSKSPEKPRFLISRSSSPVKDSNSESHFSDPFASSTSIDKHKS